MVAQFLLCRLWSKASEFAVIEQLLDAVLQGASEWPVPIAGGIQHQNTGRIGKPCIHQGAKGVFPADEFQMSLWSTDDMVAFPVSLKRQGGVACWKWTPWLLGVPLSSPLLAHRADGWLHGRLQVSHQLQKTWPATLSSGMSTRNPQVMRRWCQISIHLLCLTMMNLNRNRTFASQVMIPRSATSQTTGRSECWKWKCPKFGQSTYRKGRQWAKVWAVPRMKQLGAKVKLCLSQDGWVPSGKLT